MYNAAFPATYQPMYPTYTQTPQVPQMQAGQNDSGIMFVNGLQEASSWVVQPGQKAFLMDRNANTFYVKSVNDNGMPNPIEIYDYTKRDDTPAPAKHETIDTSDFVTHEELEARLAKLAPKRQPRRKKEAQDEPDV